MQDTLVNDFSRYGMDLSADVLKLLGDFLRVVGDKAELVSGAADLDELRRYAKNGGILKQITFDKEHLELMQKCLEKENIPFSIIGISDSNKVICMFRDKDERKVDLAKDRFNALIGKGLNEYAPDRFLEIYKEEAVGVVKDVDNVNLELLRSHLKEMDISFTVVKKDNSFNIIYPLDKQKQMDIAIKRTAWDFSSYAGADIRREIETKLENRDKVTSLLQDIKDGVDIPEDMVLIDAKNPNRFIELNDNGFVMHNLTVETKQLPNPVTNKLEPTKVVVDIKSDIVGRTSNDFEKKFFKAVNTLGEATVPIKMKNYPLFKGEEDYLVLDKDYEQRQRAFTEELKQIDRVYPKGYTVVSPMEEQVIAIKNLTDAEEYQLYQELQKVEKDAYYFNNKELAYKPEVAEQIEGILDDVIFKKKKTPLEKQLAKLRLQGYDLEEAESLVIIDKENLGQPPIMITEHCSKLQVLSQENTFNEVSITEQGDILSNFKHPVVLTVEEYTEFAQKNPDEKKVQVEEKISKVEQNFASDYLKNAEKSIKNLFEKEAKIDHATGLVNDDSLKLNSKVYKNKHLQSALQLVAAFTYEVLEGKEIKKEIENVEIDRHKISRKR
jgi:hypothetical protein